MVFRISIWQGVKTLDSIVMMIVLLSVAGVLTAFLLGRKYGVASLSAVLALVLCCCLSLCVYFFAPSFPHAFGLIGAAVGGVLLSVGIYALMSILMARRFAARGAVFDASRASGPRKPLVEFEEEPARKEDEEEQAPEKHFEGALTEAEEKPELPKLWQEQPDSAPERRAFEAALDEALFAQKEDDGEAEPETETLGEKAVEVFEPSEAFMPQLLEETAQGEETLAALPAEESPVQPQQDNAFLFTELVGREEPAAQEILEEPSRSEAVPPLVLPEIAEESTPYEEDGFIPPLEEAELTVAPAYEEAAAEAEEEPEAEAVEAAEPAEPAAEEIVAEKVTEPAELVAEQVAVEEPESGVRPEQPAEQEAAVPDDAARRKDEAIAQVKRLVAARRYDEALTSLFALLHGGAALSEDEKRQLLIIMKLLKEKGL